jgi:serine/threonine-protein kinase
MLDRIIKGKFKIVSRLGQGGMGTVYLAEQVGIGHKVALKFLKTEFSNDVEIARRFLNEAKSYARVSHPNAVTLHDFGQDDTGSLFIAMEFCEGVDLKRMMADETGLTLSESVEIILQVADVLAHAHEKGVIHRDLKPENIMVRRGLRGVHAKVLDFGIARLIDGSTKLTQAGAIAGTPRYMPPEQVEGREVDLRADVYSLGILLFEVLTKKQPFDGNTVAEILRRQVMEPMPHLWEVVPGFDSPDLDAVIQRACAKNRDERWSDMSSFAQALSRTQPSLGSSTPPVAQPPSNGRVDDPGRVLGLATGEAYGQETARTFVRRDAPAATRQPTQRYPLPVEQFLPDASIPPRVSRSPGPWIGLGVMLAAAGGFVLWRANASSNESPPVTIETPTEAPQPIAPSTGPLSEETHEGSSDSNHDAGPSPARSTNAPEEAVSLLQEVSSRESLGRGKTEFEVANLDASETLLLAVRPKTESHAEALQLLGSIGKIRGLLEAARREQTAGRCSEALPLYSAVLKLNARVRLAQEGAAACRAAAVSPTME